MTAIRERPAAAPAAASEPKDILSALRTANKLADHRVCTFIGMHEGSLGPGLVAELREVLQALRNVPTCG